MISMSDDDFYHFFELLNSLSGSTYAWEQTSAKKEHIDQFEKTINPGDVYYKRQYGNSYSQKFKLSRQSMEKILAMLFYDSLQIQAIGEHYLKIEQNKTLSLYKNTL